MHPDGRQSSSVSSPDEGARERQGFPHYYDIRFHLSGKVLTID
jgi:hypothetical protein